MSQLVWLQTKTAQANPCRGQKVVQCGETNALRDIITYLKTLPKVNKTITKNTEAEPVPNPFRAPEPLPRAWLRGGGKLQIDKLSRTRAETIFILGKTLRSRYMISNKKIKP